MFQKLNIADADFFYFADFLSSADTQNLYLHLAKLPLEQEKVQMYGQTILVPRFTALFGVYDYMYGGVMHKSLTMTNELSKLQDDVAKFLDIDFNSALVNFYPDGNHTIGLHSDNEKSLGYNPHIASISLGTTRNFILRNKETKKEHSILLENGSLLYMGDNSQTKYLHSLPKSKSKLPRFNITFRKIV